MLDVKFPPEAAMERHFSTIEISNCGRPTERWEARALLRIGSPFGMRLRWSPHLVVHRLYCSRLVAKSLSCVLAAIWASYDRDIEALRNEAGDLFGGCYIPLSGSKHGRLTPHAYGAAICLGGRTPSTRVVRAFEQNGWQQREPGQFAAFAPESPRA